MKKLISFYSFLLLFSFPSIYAQCTIDVNNEGFEYSTTIELSLTDVIYTQSGTTCNAELEVTYDVQIDVINQPGWWDESLFVLQGTFDCAGASGTSFFDLPNAGGSGTTLSAEFSFSNSMCGDVMLNCPITISIQGPGGLNESGLCGTYIGESLPITLESFNYKEIEKNSIELNWNTGSEINFSHFEIQSSKDLQTWETVGKLEGFNSSNGAQYSYDLDISTHQRYARLKMIDLDGSAEYSDNLTLPKVDNDDIKVFPNPVTNRLFLSGITTDELIIVNNIGQQFNLPTSGDNSIDVSNLATGYYAIKSIDNQIVETIRFFKQ